MSQVSSSISPQQQSKLTGLKLYICAVFTLAVTQVAAKWLATELPFGQMLFFRGLFGFIPVIAIYFLDQRRGVSTSIFRVNTKGQLFRGLAVVAITLLFFISVKGMKLTDATAISMSGPIMMVALGVLFLKEPTQKKRLICAVIGFIGVLIILRPTSEAFSFYGLAAFGSAIAYAVAAALTRSLTQTDGFFQISFWSTAIILVCGLLQFPFESWQYSDIKYWLVLLTIGVVGGFSNILYVTAFRHAEISLLAPFDYSVFIWAIFFGFVVFAEFPTPVVLIGASLIAASGIYIARQKH